MRARVCVCILLLLRYPVYFMTSPKRRDIAIVYNSGAYRDITRYEEVE